MQLDNFVGAREHAALCRAIEEMLWAGQQLVLAAEHAPAAIARCLGDILNDLLPDHLFHGLAPTIERALQITAHTIRPEENRRPKIQDIKRATAHHYHVTVIDIDSIRRTKDVVWPRQVGMYLAKTMTRNSLPEIGRRFGGRDHTTVMHAVRKIDELVKIDQEIADDIAAIREELGEDKGGQP
jgi:chromosomal replication initiator protein